MTAVEKVIDQIILHLNTATVVNIGTDREMRLPVEHITCLDGTKLSIQAGEFLYCKPRGNQSPWTHVEVMALSKDFEPIHINKEHGDDNLYAYVPIEEVAKEIIARGNLRLT